MGPSSNASGRLNILIVGHENIFHETLRFRIRTEPFCNEVLVASEMQNVLLHLHSRPIDVLLYDCSFKYVPVARLTQLISELNLAVKVILINCREGIAPSLADGFIQGIIHEDDSYSEIAKAIAAVCQSQTYISDNAVSTLQKYLAVIHKGNIALSSLERELFCSIAKGATTKEIATELGLSMATTETYRVRLLKKIGVRNTAALISYGFQNGILK